MTSVIKFAASLVALGTVLAGTAQAATAIADLPLKASILAKPNVIFGMDDSGSMDFETIVYANDGALWWNYTQATGWGIDAAHPNSNLRTITAPWFNGSGTADATWRKFAYLFPNGTGTGNRLLADSNYDHYAVMPTRQFAFLRWSGVYKDSGGVYRSAPTNPAQSSMHNPLYYNPMITYEPWAPAYLSSGLVTPANATITAAKSHPMYGTNTVDLTNNVGASTSSNKFFIAMPGMRVPAGAQKQVCNSSNGSCGSWTNVTADENATTSGVTRVAMSYYPATYWVKESCTPQNLSQVTDTCTTAPDGSTLKRYEIKSTTTSYPSGRTYAAEMQNFANWYQYFRKRKLMLSAAMGDTMETLTGMRLGVAPFNAAPTTSNANITMYDADATASSLNRMRVAGIFYESNGSGGTPTRETLRYIGEQYKRNDQTSGKYNVIQYACQRNNAFIVTDGFAYASTVTLPAWDSGASATTWGSGAPTPIPPPAAWPTLRCATSRTTRARRRPPAGMAAGVVQVTAADSNTNLHMNTYGLSLGARGTLFLGEDSTPPTSTNAWPSPTVDRSPTSVDDLWHATLNGRGKMYLATTPEETAARIRSGLEDILSQTSTQGGIAVSSINLVRGDGRAYVATYDPSGWTGNLQAVTVDRDTGVLGTTSLWNAGALLNARDWTTRVIASWSGSSGVGFTEGTVGGVVNPGGDTYGTSAQVMDYLRGSRTLEGTLFRKRRSLVGAIINSEPAIDRDTGVVYVASGEGMLHAFEAVAGADAGKELWAYVPGQVLSTMGRERRSHLRLRHQARRHAGHRQGRDEQAPGRRHGCRRPRLLRDRRDLAARPVRVEPGRERQVGIPGRR